MTQVHHEWLKKWQREVAEEYERLHEVALKDPQQSGHGGETTWKRLLEEWLPPTYGIECRKYIIPEEGDDKFETDIVIFNPGYPERLRQREEVLAGGVAAAFSVKLTLDSAGLRDSFDRSVRLRRSMKPRYGSPRHEILGAFPFGVLAHSHSWKKPSSNPIENLRSNLWRLDNELVVHPRESLDFVCIADLTYAKTFRIPYMPSRHLQHLTDKGMDTSNGLAVSAITIADVNNAAGPVAGFIAALLERLALTDPTLTSLADGLRVTDTLGSEGGQQRFFQLHDIYSKELVAALPHRGLADGDWRVAY
jgi:hypothetical protein